MNKVSNGIFNVLAFLITFVIAFYFALKIESGWNPFNYAKKFIPETEKDVSLYYKYCPAFPQTEICEKIGLNKKEPINSALRYDYELLTSKQKEEMHNKMIKIIEKDKQEKKKQLEKKKEEISKIKVE